MVVRYSLFCLGNFGFLPARRADLGGAHALRPAVWLTRSGKRTFKGRFVAVCFRGVAVRHPPCVGPPACPPRGLRHESEGDLHPGG